MARHVANPPRAPGRIAPWTEARNKQRACLEAIPPRRMAGSPKARNKPTPPTQARLYQSLVPVNALDGHEAKPEGRTYVARVPGRGCKLKSTPTAGHYSLCVEAPTANSASVARS